MRKTAAQVPASLRYNVRSTASWSMGRPLRSRCPFGDERLIEAWREQLKTGREGVATAGAVGDELEALAAGNVPAGRGGKRPDGRGRRRDFAAEVLVPEEVGMDAHGLRRVEAERGNRGPKGVDAADRGEERSGVRM